MFIKIVSVILKLILYGFGFVQNFESFSRFYPRFWFQHRGLVVIYPLTYLATSKNSSESVYPIMMMIFNFICIFQF